jgi:hypothetical protein
MYKFLPIAITRRKLAFDIAQITTAIFSAFSGPSSAPYTAFGGGDQAEQPKSGLTG